MRYMFLILGSVGLVACGDKIDAVQFFPSSCPETPVTYEGQVRGILDALCTSCHASTLSGSARNGAPVAVDLDTFSAAKASADSSYSRLQNDAMPPGATKASKAQKDQFSCWLTGGTQERP